MRLRLSAVVPATLVLWLGFGLESTLVAQVGSTVPNWAVARTGARSGVKTAMTDITDLEPFLGVTPCRIVDTRGPAGTYGGPPLAAGSPRNFSIPLGPCAGLPSNASAYSLNITVTNTQGPGFILIYPQGSSQPLVSTLNYVPGQSIANAAIVPAGSLGGVTVVAGVSGTDLIIDINGYYGKTPGDSGRYLQISNTSGGYSILTDNSSLTCSGPCGIAASVESPNDAIAIQGGAPAGSGRNRGVFGLSFSTTPGAAGVYGEDASGPAGAGAENTFAAVYGSTTSGYAVLGVSKNQGYGVKGASLNGSGVSATAGYLGYDNSTAIHADGNFTATGTKSFVEPHPQDPSKAIDFVALEGPEAGTYFRGSSEFTAGRATIEVPEAFRMVTDPEGLTVQITPIGGFAQVYVESQDLNQIVVRGSKDVRFHYTVNGVRHAFKDHNAIVENTFFRPEGASSIMPAAFAPEQKRILIQTGVYNGDGTVNLGTAEKMGWTKIWAERIEIAKAAAARRAAEGNAQYKK